MSRLSEVFFPVTFTSKSCRAISTMPQCASCVFPIFFHCIATVTTWVKVFHTSFLKNCINNLSLHCHFFYTSNCPIYLLDQPSQNMALLLHGLLNETQTLGLHLHTCMCTFREWSQTHTHNSTYTHTFSTLMHFRIFSRTTNIPILGNWWRVWFKHQDKAPRWF